MKLFNLEFYSYPIGNKKPESLRIIDHTNRNQCVRKDVCYKGTSYVFIVWKFGKSFFSR